MKAEIHPNYIVATVTCACGHSFQTRSTKKEIHLEICSNCHPFFTGKQKLIDSAGRVERFSKRFEKTSGKTIRAQIKEKPAKAKLSKTTRKILSTSAKKVKAALPEKKSTPAKAK